MSSSDKAAKLIRTVVEVLEPQFAIKLWNGERIGPDTGPVLAINDPTILRRIAFRPNIDSIIELWVSGQVDIENGTIFDIAELGTKGKLKTKIKSLPKWQLLKDLPSALFGSSRNDSGLAGKDPFDSGSSQEAIRHHYDISNEFYKLFLDDAMVYTCAYFTDWTNDIHQAQLDKLDHVCKKLRLQPGDHLLDIGCGWGSMLIHAVKHYGVIGHGVSLSDAQTELARERIRAEGLGDKITIEIKSYEHLDSKFHGQFDKISSIGMFEAVGLDNYDTYFSTLNRLLKPGGLYLHHAITRRAKKTKKAFNRKSKEHLALVKYIFPGGELDHLGMSIENLEGHGFEVHDTENLREHYGLTCRIWANRLHARFDEAIAEVGAPKARLWLFYLTGCALAFERGTVQINQTLASKRVRGPSGLPSTRADLYK